MAQQLIRQRISPGDRVIDATVGNGHDTLFLAQSVGQTGSVIGFDIQEMAIASASKLVSGMRQVAFHQMDHAQLAETVTAPIQAAMFNLGYLPSGDKSLITKPPSTLSALNSTTKILSSGGLITIVVYTGHPGGPEESEAVMVWASALDQSQFTVIRYDFLNRMNHAPYLLAVEKNSDPQ